MSDKSRTAKVMGGALAGAGSGAAAGSLAGPYGALIGGGVGAVGGGIAGYLGDQADEEERKNDPEYQAAVRREKAMKMMSASLGRAFGAMRPTSMQGAMSRGI